MVIHTIDPDNSLVYITHIPSIEKHIGDTDEFEPLDALYPLLLREA